MILVMIAENRLARAHVCMRASVYAGLYARIRVRQLVHMDVHMCVRANGGMWADVCSRVRLCKSAAIIGCVQVIVNPPVEVHAD